MEEFYGIEYIHVNYEQLWSPEIILHNNADGVYMPDSFKARFSGLIKVGVVILC